jgi:putative transposase
MLRPTIDTLLGDVGAPVLPLDPANMGVFTTGALANAFVERFIGSARRECLDHVIVFNEAGLQRLMTGYCSYHERSRTHLALDKDTPIPRPVTLPGDGAVVAIPEVGALHHRYERRVA